MSVCRIRLILVVTALIATGFGTPAGAQTALTELKLGQRYWVTQTDGVEIRGYLTATTPTDVSVNTDRGHVTIPTADVFRIAKPDGLKNGALIGAGVGVGFVFLSAGTDNSDGPLDGTTFAIIAAGLVASAGGAVGALLDKVVSPRKTVYQKAAAAPLMQIVPAMHKGGVGVRGTVRW